MLKKLKNLKLLTGDSTFSQLFRTYLVGAFNLVFGLGTSYIFQFFVFNLIDCFTVLKQHFPNLQDYLQNSLSKLVSYF